MQSFWSKRKDGAAAGNDVDSVARMRAVQLMGDHTKKYVTSSVCRRVLILDYFGENWKAAALSSKMAIKGVPDKDGKCGHCDNCNRAAARDAAMAAAAAAGVPVTQSTPGGGDAIPHSHIYFFALAAHETGEKNGLSYLQQFVKGSKSAKINERSQTARVKPLSACKSYGSLSDASAKYLGALGRFLCQVGVLEQVYRGEFQIVVLGPHGKQLLQPGGKDKGTAKFRLTGAEILPPELMQELGEAKSTQERKEMSTKQRIAARKASENASAALAAAAGGASFDAHAALRLTASPHELQLVDLLVELRAQISKTLGVAPYIIFSRNELDAFAKYRPTTLQALAKFSGVTQTKLDKYGESFIKQIKTFATQEGLQMNLPLPELSASFAAAAVSSAPAVGGAVSAAVGDVMSYVDYLMRHKAVTAADQTRSAPCSWHQFPPGPLTRINMMCSDNYLCHDKPVKRMDAWTAVQASPTTTFEAVAQKLEISVALVISQNKHIHTNTLRKECRSIGASACSHSTLCCLFVRPQNTVLK